MRVVTNERLARRNRQFAQYMFFASFGVPILGLLLINQQTAEPTGNVFISLIVPFLVLPIAYGVMLFSIRMSNLWVRQPRPEAAIAEGLKGVSNKNVLYNYYFFPARHLLISPFGVFAMTTRFQDNFYRNEGDRWQTVGRTGGRIFQFIRMNQIGNPTRDAQQAAEHVKELLATIAPDVPVQPLIIFVDPRVSFETLDPAVPVLHADPKRDVSLKDYLREVAKEKRPTLTPQQIQAFEQATLAGA